MDAPSIDAMRADAPSNRPRIPGLLERIVFTEPEVASRVVLRTVCLLVLLLIGWSLIGRLDIVAVAEGRLVPRSLTKTVQVAEAGVLSELLVDEGDEVAEGQVIARMDRTLAVADHRSLTQDLALKRLTLRRIDAERENRLPEREPGDDPALFEQIRAQAMSKRQEIADATAQEAAMLERARRDLQAGEETIAKLTAVLPSITRSAEAFSALRAQGFVSDVHANERDRERIEKAAELRAQRATTASLRATIDAQTKKLAMIRSAWQSELQVERTRTLGEIARLERELDKADFRDQVMELRAPQGGIVKELATRSRGAVLAAGSVLASIVPKADPLVAEIRVRNVDIGFVEAGQHVELKVAAYPFQKYGLLPGWVLAVAPDATDPQAREPADESLPFKATIALDGDALTAQGRRFPLVAGMMVQAELHQGTRTVMEYLLSPVRQVVHEAGRER